MVSCRDSKWDEWISITDRFRFSNLYDFSAGSVEFTDEQKRHNSNLAHFLTGEVTHNLKPVSKVYVRPPQSNTWIGGFVLRIDKQQVQIQYKLGNQNHQFWFHVESPDITLDSAHK